MGAQKGKKRGNEAVEVGSRVMASVFTKDGINPFPSYQHVSINPISPRLRYLFFIFPFISAYGLITQTAAAHTRYAAGSKIHNTTVDHRENLMSRFPQIRIFLHLYIIPPVSGSS